MIISNQKSLFDIPADITFLNCSNMSPLLQTVRQAGIKGIDKRSHPWEIKTDDWFSPAEELRECFARIIHADKENIALIPSVSYGIATAARNIPLKAHQKIIVLDQQYPSNIYSWLELSKETGAEIITIKRKPGWPWTQAILEKIDHDTGLVALPNCHWTDGSIIDLEEISKAVKKVNAGFVIDASQSAGVYPLDINKIKPDFLVTVGYKWLLGPYGLGYLYADEKYVDTGRPIEYSWLNKKGSEDFTRLADYPETFRPGARRFDKGEFPSFILIPMAVQALRQIMEWGVENIQDTLSILTDEIDKKAAHHGFDVPKRKDRVGHMTGIKLAANDNSRLDKKLTENKVYLSFRGSSMRIAPHVYNSLHDIDKLFQVISS